MSRVRRAVALAVLLIVCSSWLSCAERRVLRATTPELWVSLRWVRGHPGETREDVVTGLAWSLYFLGARWPAGSLAHAVVWTDEQHLRLNLSAAGFDPHALRALAKLWTAFAGSEELRRHGGIDAGRFVALSLNSTRHYYRITGAAPRYADFRRRFRFERRRAHVLASNVAHGHRAVELSAHGGRLDRVAFIALEGPGSLRDGSFDTREFEVLDFLPNGQPRFALYDRQGRLKTGADPALTRAGKPAKCLWCHETSLMPALQPWAAPNAYSSVDFNAHVEERMRLVSAERQRAASDVDVAQRQPEHSKAEFLYLSFMEPSVARLAQEWGLAEDEAQALLSGLPTHAQHEFAFLGKALYERRDVDRLAPYANVRPPDDAREAGGYEPDLIGD